MPIPSSNSSSSLYNRGSARSPGYLERELTLQSLTSGRGSYLTDRPRPPSILAAEDDDDRQARPPKQNVPASASVSSSHKKRKKKRSPVTANLSGTRYDIIGQMTEALGFTIAKEEDQSCYLFWNDSFVSTERISELKSYQRINHFPGMGEICRKDCLSRNMAKIQKAHPEEFNFVPKTWILPSEYSAFINHYRELKKKKKNKTFIVKPANGAMGNGICLIRNGEKIPQNDHMIVQEYIDKPFMVDGYKCDMRIYVLVTSCDPLKIFLYHDGLLRMGTERYIHPTDSNLEHLYMHLTNYSVNKHNDNYEKSTTVDTGSKRSLKYFNDYLRRHDYDVAFLWKNITDIIIKTLIVSHPHVLHAYRMCRPGQAPGSDSVCFEILGFDIMLDRKLRPWLLEINRSPSFGTDEKIDYDIKSGVIGDSLRLLNIKGSDKRKNMAQQKAEAQKRLMRPTKRVDQEMTEMERKRQNSEKKKDELRDMLTRIRKEAAREDFENRNSGRFKRIFPPDDKFRREKYANLLAEAYGVFLSGRGNALQEEIKRTYQNKLREEDILDMIAQCEADERDGRLVTSSRPPRGPKQDHFSDPDTTKTKRPASRQLQPLQSMPVLVRENDYEDLEDEDEESASEEDVLHRKPPSGSAVGSRPGSDMMRPTSGRSTSYTSRSRSLNRPISMNKLNAYGEDDELIQRTLTALNDMRIKFPGKTDEEAEYILDKLHENWKFHKPRIASYWLVKLDSIKRRKVIDIVRSNVKAVLQRTWKNPDVDNLRIYRIFSRVFNRLLWSHGQGLWNCFQSAGNSWETIFSKSTDSISHIEMGCCRRIVQLCRDCLLIVYQFAAEAKTAAGQVNMNESEYTRTTRPPTNLEKASWNPGHTVSQRLSRLYHNRSQSLNSLNYGMS